LWQNVLASSVSLKMYHKLTYCYYYYYSHFASLLVFQHYFSLDQISQKPSFSVLEHIFAGEVTILLPNQQVKLLLTANFTDYSES